MHNLAIALKLKGYVVSGSDDEIFEPSKSRLAEQGLLPNESGWHPEKITDDIDTVILGMHAREDNPELVKARNIGIDIKSFPEYLYEQTKEKKTNYCRWQSRKNNRNRHDNACSENSGIEIRLYGGFADRRF